MPINFDIEPELFATAARSADLDYSLHLLMQVMDAKGEHDLGGSAGVWFSDSAYDVDAWPALPVTERLGHLVQWFEHERKALPFTFKQFQATREECNDLGAKLADARWEDEPPAQGFLYLGALYIEKAMPHWPAESRARGKYYLILGREEWITDNLEELEGRLFDYAVSEGYHN